MRVWGHCIIHEGIQPRSGFHLGFFFPMCHWGIRKRQLLPKIAHFDSSSFEKKKDAMKQAVTSKFLLTPLIHIWVCSSRERALISEDERAHGTLDKPTDCQEPCILSKTVSSAPKGTLRDTSSISTITNPVTGSCDPSPHPRSLDSGCCFLQPCWMSTKSSAIYITGFYVKVSWCIHISGKLPTPYSCKGGWESEWLLLIF